MNNSKPDTELNAITSQWSNWISKQTKFQRINKNKIQVLTSFTDAFDDGILFNILSNDNGTYHLTDNGYTIWNLETNGINVSNKGSNRHRILISIISPYSFQLDDNKAISKNNIRLNELPQAITDFVQVLINVSDIAFMSRSNTASIFTDDVHNFFNDNRKSFNFFTNAITIGKSNQNYRFDYNFIPKKQQFKLTKMYNTLSKNTMDSIIGIYVDTADYIQDNFGQDSSFNILLNGITAKEKEYISGLQEHNINVINFQDKQDVTSSLGSVG